MSFLVRRRGSKYFIRDAAGEHEVPDSQAEFLARLAFELAEDGWEEGKPGMLRRRKVATISGSKFIGAGEDAVLVWQNDSFPSGGGEKEEM